MSNETSVDPAVQLALLIDQVEKGQQHNGSYRLRKWETHERLFWAKKALEAHEAKRRVLANFGSAPAQPDMRFVLLPLEHPHPIRR